MQSLPRCTPRLAILALTACNTVLGLDERPRRPDDPVDAGEDARPPTPARDAGDGSVVDVGPPKPPLPTAGLVAHFPLDGDAQDSVEPRADGVVTRALPTSDRFGRAGKAMSFDGAGAYIVVPATKLPRAATPRTLAAWFRTGTTVPEWQTIANWGSDRAYQRFSLSIHGPDVGAGPGLVRFSGQFIDVEGGFVADDLWHHAAATYDGKAVELYVDGAFARKGTFALDTAGASLVLGGKVPAGTGEYLIGAIDDVRVYDRRLDAAEIGVLADETP
jgi:hypothetical protein